MKYCVLSRVGDDCIVGNSNGEVTVKKGTECVGPFPLRVWGVKGLFVGRYTRYYTPVGVVAALYNRHSSQWFTILPLSSAARPRVTSRRSYLFPAPESYPTALAAEESLFVEADHSAVAK